jgi:hypothetical protein
MILLHCVIIHDVQHFKAYKSYTCLKPCAPAGAHPIVKKKIK